MIPEPKATIAVPTYNRSGLLKLSIKSILTQDYADFRFIVLDNASTDDSEAVVRSYAEVTRQKRNQYRSVPQLESGHRDQQEPVSDHPAGTRASRILESGLVTVAGALRGKPAPTLEQAPYHADTQHSDSKNEESEG